MSKYKNHIVRYDGMKFDSKKELNRYCELKIMEKAGLIENLECQVPFELIPTQRIPGETVKKVKYIADFVYWDNDKNMQVVEDVKGIRTPVYNLKKKLMLYRYGIWITEV